MALCKLKYFAKWHFLFFLWYIFIFWSQKCWFIELILPLGSDAVCIISGSKPSLVLCPLWKRHLHSNGFCAKMSAVLPWCLMRKSWHFLPFFALMKAVVTHCGKITKTICFFTTLHYNEFAKNVQKNCENLRSLIFGQVNFEQKFWNLHRVNTLSLPQRSNSISYNRYKTIETAMLSWQFFNTIAWFVWNSKVIKCLLLWWNSYFSNANFSN